MFTKVLYFSKIVKNLLKTEYCYFYSNNILNAEVVMVYFLHCCSTSFAHPQ